ncbi:glycosyltransferase [Solicola gregarius]|uniref:Glycosyltransferase n=1 Tax=Solicola gregarius TaxID=2908642 RepID=A0AA46TES7_9ACTN|nr:glycosyltransferase [Solicola gregarius]UYM04027.1 glycosyltransferase [Solicola gregarius]
MSTRVVAVVVTWNRRDLLVEALDALRKQSAPVSALVVVDNASTDETPATLRTYDDLDVVTLAENTGGAGGFAAGIERALDAHAPDLIWLMDDDTVATPTASERLLDVYASADPTPVVLASRVVWTDGRDHPMNTPRRKPRASADEVRRAAAVDAIPVRSASFVSIMCDADTVRERGLPIADYFLWNDDFEYSTRLLRGRTGLYCPDSVVVHKTKAFGSTDADPGSRFYYEVRNKTWLFTRSRGLAPLEKAVYGGSTARRWIRTIAASSDRRTLWRGLGRGLRDGIRSGPRSNEVVLRNVRTTDGSNGNDRLPPTDGDFPTS